MYLQSIYLWKPDTYNNQEYQAKHFNNMLTFQNDKQERIKPTRLTATDLKFDLLSYSAKKLDKTKLD